VIGIIALLISILLPSLSKARESANQVKCSSQIRQITQAMILHSQSRKGYLPLVGATPGSGLPADVKDVDRRKYDYFDDGGTTRLTCLPAAISSELGQPARDDSKANVEADIQTGIIRQLFLCPSDREGGRYGQLIVNGPQNYNSYAFNEAALGFADAGTLGVVGHNRGRGNLARFRYTSELMLLTDGAPRGGDGAGRWQVYYDHAADCTLADIYNQNTGANPNAKATAKDCGDWDLLDKNRHRGRINVGFADGHVTTVIISEGDLEKISLNRGF